MRWLANEACRQQHRSGEALDKDSSIKGRVLNMDGTPPTDGGKVEDVPIPNHLG